MKALPQGLTRDESGRYRVRFQSKHTRPGQMYRERLPERTTQRQAESYLAKLREDDRMERLHWPNEKRSEAPSQKSYTFGEYVVERYIPWCEANNRERTLDRKRELITSMSPWFWDRPLGEVTAGLISDYAIERKKEGVRSRTVNLGLETLRHILRMAEEDGWLEKVPRVRMLKVSDSRPSRWLSKEEGAKVVEEARKAGAMWYALVQFFLHTGARLGEARNLLWKDVDLEEKWVRFHGHQTKSGRGRVLPLEEEVVEALSKLPRVGDRVFMRQIKGEWKALPMDFRSKGRYPWDPKGMSVPPHTFRHTFATWKLQAGVSPALVQAWLGHSTIALTVDTYGHVLSLI